jgi:hypothetical protein
MQSKAWTVFARWITGIMGSNPTQGMDICLFLFCVYVGISQDNEYPDRDWGWVPPKYNYHFNQLDMLLRYNKMRRVGTRIVSRKMNIFRRSVYMQFRGDYANWHPPQNFALRVHPLITLSISRLYRFANQSREIFKMWLWAPRDWEQGMALLARPSNNLLDQPSPCSIIWQDDIYVKKSVD